MKLESSVKYLKSIQFKTRNAYVEYPSDAGNVAQEIAYCLLAPSHYLN